MRITRDLTARENDTDPLSRAARTLVGGIVGGILGTSIMILVGLGLELLVGVGRSELLPTLEAGFGGPLSTAGAFYPIGALPIHFVHGALLGLLLGTATFLAPRFRWSSALSPTGAGILFGFVLTPIVVVLLTVTDPTAVSWGASALVAAMHVLFGAAAGQVIAVWSSR